MSSERQRLRQRSDELWARLQTTCVQISFDKGEAHASPTFGVFAERFDRCFRRVSCYVAARVNDRERFERVVTEALAENLGVCIAQLGELEELKRLRTSADRLLARLAQNDSTSG